ncbi:ArfGap-domain-containing protein [Laetiporus sulphureus 93-53]|uniref:ArfGap-domain-containing protein n=1 Tax=Laetiporus sulphureus 93-53 TaxID=1314785 RepID=A0A165E7L3_9APHY|nr:ArfGap-domain-containing protein [Laetiporus sulphureus 93-53]KZT06393.1 ArfGap-domain-containing protein [Laetiporus sulphureus 93-53]
MDQAVARKTLQDLIKREDLENKKCIDCQNPNPQWASLSFAVFLCLQCAGAHRGFGVHVSFVRSVSMDTWQEDQVKRMQLGGNALFREFMKTYPAEQGGYTPGMSPYDTYHCWAASQYREKLDAELAGKPWSPSAPPAGTSPSGAASPPGRPSSAQGLRKSRASARTSTGRQLRSDSSSPASFGNGNSPGLGSASPTSATPLQQDQKAANETFFAGLGEANASRSADLHPSQGGRYQGFGNTPSPASNPSYGLSSRAAPSLAELQENPVAALSKGWSLFSAAVAGATRAVNDNVIQPGVGKVMDPNFQSGVRGYVSEAGKRVGEAGRSANTWSKNALGVDVAQQVGGVVGTVKDRVVGGPERRGYSSVDVGYAYVGETSALYADHEEEEEFFDTFSSAPARSASTASKAPGNAGSSAAAAKKDDDWDEWKDF